MITVNNTLGTLAYIEFEKIFGGVVKSIGVACVKIELLLLMDVQL